MPQVVRTTNDLISNSLLLIGELAVGEAADAFMLSTGLELINALLDQWTLDSIYVPYLTTLSSNFIVGKDTYSISDMLLGTDIRADQIIDLSFANYTVPGVGINQNLNPSSFDFTADTITNTLTLGSTQLFPTGTPFVITTTGTVPSPLITSVTYYSIFVNATQIKIAASVQDALNGIPIQLLTNGVPINTIIVNSLASNTVETSLVYPLRIINKATYWGIVRQTNLQARPGFIFLNKQPLESLITVYPVPDQPYPFTIQCKLMLNALEAQSNLNELAPFFYKFMKYAIGREFIAYYPSANWPQTNEDTYQDMYNSLKSSVETDLTLRPSVILTAPEPFYWPNILSY